MNPWEPSHQACVSRRSENAELLRVLPPDLVALEARYARYRWAGYQFMSPLACTRQFAKEYSWRFGRTFYGSCDFEPELGTTEFETLWRMRMAADASFLSYPRYLRIAFHLYRRKDPGPFRQPHLIFKKRQETVSWRKQEKKDHQDYGFENNRIASMGEFQRQSYCGLPAQDDFKARIRRGAKERGWGRTAALYVMQSPHSVACGTRCRPPRDGKA